MHSLTGAVKQALSSEKGFSFKDLKEVPSKLAYDGVIYVRSPKTFNTKDEAKTYGSELKQSGKAKSIRIGNGKKSGKKIFFVYVLGGSVQRVPDSVQKSSLAELNKKSKSTKKEKPTATKEEVKKPVAKKKKSKTKSSKKKK